MGNIGALCPCGDTGGLGRGDNVSFFSSCGKIGNLSPFYSEGKFRSWITFGFSLVSLVGNIVTGCFLARELDRLKLGTESFIG